MPFCGYSVGCKPQVARGGRGQQPVINSLRTLLKHDGARRLATKDLLAWRDHMMATHSSKTVNDIYLSTVRSLFAWAVDNERLPENPAANVGQPKPRKVRSRGKGFTEEEALAGQDRRQSEQPRCLIPRFDRAILSRE